MFRLLTPIMTMLRHDTLSVVTKSNSRSFTDNQLHKCMGIITDYRPLELCRNKPTDSIFALIILNQPLEPYGNAIPNLWKKACFRALSDGGANRLFHYLKAKNLNVDDFLPNLVNGDFDSISDDVKKYYEGKGCEFVFSDDQNTTDFTKSLNLVSERMQQSRINLDYVVTVVNTSGRFDHIMGNIQSLYLGREVTDKTVFLLAEKCITWLMEPGRHRISVDKTIMEKSCGLLPLGEPCRRITTTGLKWNLNDQELRFGALISTSNTYSSEIVTIENDSPVIWTMEINHENA